MSGRGRSGRAGRGRLAGRGRGRFNRRRSFRNNNKKRYFNSSNQKEYKFHPHSFGRQHYATYASVKEMLIQNIQKSWDGGYDIAKSLRQMLMRKHRSKQVSTLNIKKNCEYFWKEKTF